MKIVALAHILDCMKHQNSILVEEAENRTSKQILNSIIMKTITLLAASILLMTNAAKASEFKAADVTLTTPMAFDEPLSFTERGIEFFVFPNGDFDFNTRPNDSQGDYQYKSAGRKSAEVNRGNRPVNYGVLIEHDSFGRVRRVGNTFINYDRDDRVSRIGTVYMKYNRTFLDQIGNMKIIYNRRGEIVDTVGSIKGRKYQGYAYNTSNNNYYPTVSHNNDDYYYYKTDGTKAVIEEKK